MNADTLFLSCSVWPRVTSKNFIEKKNVLRANIPAVKTRFAIVLVRTWHCTWSFCGSTLTNPPE